MKRKTFFKLYHLFSVLNQWLWVLSHQSIRTKTEVSPLKFWKYYCECHLLLTTLWCIWISIYSFFLHAWITSSKLLITNHRMRLRIIFQICQNQGIKKKKKNQGLYIRLDLLQFLKNKKVISHYNTVTLQKTLFHSDMFRRPWSHLQHCHNTVLRFMVSSDSQKERHHSIYFDNTSKYWNIIMFS